MSPEQLAAVRLAYLAKVEEWERLLSHPDTTLRQLGELRWRLSSAEFAHSCSTELELFRLEWLERVTRAMNAQTGFEVWTEAPHAPDDVSSLTGDP